MICFLNIVQSDPKLSKPKETNYIILVQNEICNTVQNSQRFGTGMIYYIYLLVKFTVPKWCNYHQNYGSPPSDIDDLCLFWLPCLGPLVILLPKLNFFGFPVFRYRTCLMKVIPETCRAH
jgi:hypothetical protein